MREKAQEGEDGESLELQLEAGMYLLSSSHNEREGSEYIIPLFLPWAS